MQTQLQQAAQRYHVILSTLKSTDHPVTLNELYEKPEVRALSQGKHNVNDALKVLRKQKLVARVPSNKTTHRYEYQLKEKSLVNLPNIAVRRTRKKKGETVDSTVSFTKHDVETTQSKAQQFTTTITNRRNITKELELLRTLSEPSEYKTFIKLAVIGFPEHREQLLAELETIK